MGGLTELELSRPYSFRGINDKTLCEITLNTTDHVMIGRFSTFADDTKRVILHDRCPTDSTEKALLNTAIEAEDCNFG